MRWVWAHRTLEPADELLLHEHYCMNNFAWRVVKNPSQLVRVQKGGTPPFNGSKHTTGPRAAVEPFC